MRGFSLIEMIAAFLVFAIGIGVLMRILATSMHSARESSQYTTAALWAQSRLDIVGIGEPIEAGQSSGNFDDNYHWELNIQQVDPSSVDPSPRQPMAGGMQNQGMQQRQVSAANAGNAGGITVTPFDIYQVDLTVLWGDHDGSRPHSAHFSTLRVMNPDPNNAQGANPQMKRSGAAQ